MVMRKITHGTSVSYRYCKLGNARRRECLIDKFIWSIGQLQIPFSPFDRDLERANSGKKKQSRLGHLTLPVPREKDVDSPPLPR